MEDARQHHLPVECAAVVKGDGYGCGLEPVTQTLYERRVQDLLRRQRRRRTAVRALAPEATIYVLGGIMPGSAQAFANDYLQPVINSTTELAEWDGSSPLTTGEGAPRSTSTPA